MVATGMSFPLEREEAVDAWAAGVALGAEASEAATAGGTTSDLAFLDGGSIKPSSLQKGNGRQKLCRECEEQEDRIK
jgi:hypothetical protein